MLLNQDKMHWEKVGKNYAVFWKSKIKKELNKQELQFINKYLQKTKGVYILDIGIGSGRIVENYLSFSKDPQVDGIDWAQSMVTYCKKKFNREKRVKNLKVCDISQQEIPFRTKYDFISAIRILKYNKNWQDIIRKVMDSLEKDGIFVFTIYNKNAFLRFTKPDTNIYKATEEEIRNVVKKQGGEILNITSFSRLPDAFYDFSNNKIYVAMILFFEKTLRNLLQETSLGRELFIAAKKSK